MSSAALGQSYLRLAPRIGGVRPELRSENSWDIAGGMYDRDDCDWTILRVVHHQVRIDVPESQRLVGQVLARVAESRIVRKKLECFLEFVVDLESRVNAVFGDERS